MIIFAAVIGTFQFRVHMGNACLIITLMLGFFCLFVFNIKSHETAA